MLFSVKLRLCFSCPRRAQKLAQEFYVQATWGLWPFPIKCCSLGRSEACSMGILAGFVSRALTVLLLPPKNMIKEKLNSQLPLRTKHHPFPFLSLPEVTWISGDSVIKKNRVVQTAFPLLLLQASGRSSCSFAHLFLLSPISHQLLRISSFLGL